MANQNTSQQLAFSEAPYKTPMIDMKTGVISPAWQKWFQQLYIRVGGALTAPIQNLNSLPLVNLIAATITTVIQTYYTSPVGQKTVINSLTITNPDTVAHTISVWFVTAGTTAISSGPNANIVINNVSIAGGQEMVFPNLQFQVLNGGDFIQSQASVNGVMKLISDGRLSS